MAINLEKKKPFDLTKKAPGLKNIVAGLGWDSSEINGKQVDCDVSLFMLDETGKIPSEGYFVFYNNLLSEDGAVKHQGDNRDGDGDGDDEVIGIDLAKINERIQQIIFTVTIHESEERGHHFGNVSNSFIRVYNQNSKEEICRFDLAEKFDGTDSLLMGRLYRAGGSDWNFEAVANAYAGGLQTLVDTFA